jgi:hypothetical protein
MNERFRQIRTFSAIVGLALIASFSLSACRNIEPPANTKRNLPPNQALPMLASTATLEPTPTSTPNPQTPIETCLTLENQNDTGVLTRNDQIQWTFGVRAMSRSSGHQYNSMALVIDSNSSEFAREKTAYQNYGFFTGNDMEAFNTKTSKQKNTEFKYMAADGLDLQCTTKQVDPNNPDFSYLEEIDTCTIKCDPHLWTIKVLSPSSTTP